MFATDRGDCVIQIGLVRDWCDTIAQKQINKATFSRWCGWLQSPGSRADFVPVPIAASLLTFASLHRIGVRDFKGKAYNEIYPIAYRRVTELTNDGLSDTGAIPTAANSPAPQTGEGA